MLGILNIGPWELILILVVMLIVFGPGKLPEVAQSLGKAVREFRKASSNVQRVWDEVTKEEAPVKPVNSRGEESETGDQPGDDTSTEQTSTQENSRDEQSEEQGSDKQAEDSQQMVDSESTEAGSAKQDETSENGNTKGEES